MRVNVLLGLLALVLSAAPLRAQEGLLGEVRLFAGNFAPQNWMFCQGQLLPIAQNQALFSLLGTTFGGDGETTFALPDLRGRSPISAGQGPGLSLFQMGQVGGQESVTLSTPQLPSHSHAAFGASTPGTFAKVTGNLPANHSSAYANSNPVAMNPGLIGTTGEGQPVATRSPFLALHFIICVSGVYPTQN